MDEKIVEKAMSDYGNVVLRCAISVTGNRTDAEDVFSDVFFALYKNGKDFSCEAHLRAWLIRVAVNKAKNIVNSAWAKRRAVLTENISAPSLNFDNDVFAALQELKSDDRSIIYMHYYEGYAFKEIAQMLSMRESSVRSRASRARAALKEFLSD